MQDTNFSFFECLFKADNKTCSLEELSSIFQISYFVGVPLLLLLLVAVLVLCIVVSCLCVKLREAKRKIRTNEVSKSEALKEAELEPCGESIGLGDSFESIEAVVENNKRDTVVNNNYDLVKLNTDNDNGETEGDTEKPEYTNINEKKKKNKKRLSSNKHNKEDENIEKDGRYNKLVHGSEHLQQLGIDMDSYSALDKPKTKGEGNSDTGVSKVKELPPIPTQKKDLPQPGSSGKTPVLIPSKDSQDPYQDVAKPTKEEVKDDREVPESVYYNDAVVAISKLAEEAKTIESATEKEKRLNIYSQSISLNDF